MNEEKLRQRLNEIDKILDDESISDDEFDEFEDEARRIEEEKAQQKAEEEEQGHT